jgi:glycerol-3-phosphate cytidylyltransferase
MQEVKKVYIPGVWDLFHVGHLNVLREAKNLGMHLIVGVCSDDLVFQTKKMTPIIKEEWRKEVVGAINIVNDTIIYRNLDYFETFNSLKANIFAVGEEFGYLPEHQSALKKFKEIGVKVHFIQRFKGISTTEIKENLIYNM